MVARRSKGNPTLVRLVGELKKSARAHSAPIWAAVADRLERPRHQVVPVNVGQLERLAEAGETVVVAGKLLAEGRLAKRLTVGAFAFSGEARSKIQAAGGSALSLAELVKSHPDGSGVRLLA
ncbi:MAG TPA: 50S ribosomal protein L18e [Thermoplasmata archaeon]|nr:50S ribosomal protein L18e [Thermoplasmata archaeon]